MIEFANKSSLVIDAGDISLTGYQTDSGFCATLGAVSQLKYVTGKFRVKASGAGTYELRAGSETLASALLSGAGAAVVDVDLSLVSGSKPLSLATSGTGNVVVHAVLDIEHPLVIGA